MNGHNAYPPNAAQTSLHADIQKMPNHFPLGFSPSPLCLFVACPSTFADCGIGLSPDAAALIAAILCFALSSP